MRVVLYARVSTRDKDQSPKNQFVLLRLSQVRAAREHTVQLNLERE